MLIGEWLSERDREDLVVGSKVYYNQHSRFDEDLSRKSIRTENEHTHDTDQFDRITSSYD